MKRTVVALLFALSFVLPSFAADGWDDAVKKLTASTVYFEIDGEGSCTGFVVNANATPSGKADHGTDYVATAAHCDGGKLFADHVPAQVVYKNTKKDLLVVEVADLTRPALKLAAKNPEVGDSVASYGFGLGLERPMLRIATVADNASTLPEYGIGGPYIQTDAQFVPGQSGGPVVNKAGEIVAIVQMGGSGVGLGVGAETLRAEIGRFFEK